MRSVKAFDGFLLLLPDGAAGHGDDLERLRIAAELQAMEGWLVGCRDQRPANDVPRPRRRVVVITPLGTVGAPIGTLAGALAKAGTRDGCEYVISAFDAAACR